MYIFSNDNFNNNVYESAKHSLINSTILKSIIDNLVIVEQTSNKLGGRKIVDIAIQTIILILLF